MLLNLLFYNSGYYFFKFLFPHQIAFEFSFGLYINLLLKKEIFCFELTAGSLGGTFDALYVERLILLREAMNLEILSSFVSTDSTTSWSIL